MLRFPTTLLDFQAQFPDEASCWAYLRRKCSPLPVFQFGGQARRLTRHAGA